MSITETHCDEWEENPKKELVSFAHSVKGGWGRKKKEKNKWLLTLLLQVTNCANFLFSLIERPMRKFNFLIKSSVCFYRWILKFELSSDYAFPLLYEESKFFFFFTKYFEVTDETRRERRTGVPVGVGLDFWPPSTKISFFIDFSLHSHSHIQDLHLAWQIRFLQQ